MEFDNPDKIPSDRETSFYENTKVATQKCAGQSKQNKMDDDEGHYEHLRLESKVEESKPYLQEDVIKRIKVISSVFLALLIALYIGVVALVIFIAVPKGQDGGWSVWEDWGTCTDSCGGGVRIRSRSCTNPTPSLSGRPCTGDYTDVSTCNKTTCPDHNVAFTAYDIYRNASNYSILRFRNTYINNGDGYDTTTGKFTCSMSGVYHFVVTLSKSKKDIGYLYAYLKINGIVKLSLLINPNDDGSNEVGHYMMTGAGTFHLNQNDVVYVYGVPDYFYYGRYSYFTGFLITPDQ